MESHLYEGVEPSDVYNKLENVLSTQTSAVKVNIALGYELVSKTDPDDTLYFYPNLANTHVFNNPIAINSKADIQKKVISEIRSMELADKLNYPSSGEAVIPKIIRENKHVINFLKTNNKCVFHCIAWHTFQSPKKDLRSIQTQSHSARRGGAAYASSNPSVNLSDLADRGLWSMDGFATPLEYTSPTSASDQNVAKVLGGWTDTKQAGHPPTLFVSKKSRIKHTQE
ncbi:unnamed protein product [Phytophthora lilii]|uniref:Unnamed protein product n=1 Tax=Phytophthora lilii TaxID=2077276 RepID=A0A9W7D8G1_9STRA|nr:unnamed protein product [Phytophthora lilii]